MNIYIGDKQLKSLSKGTTSVKEVYVGSSKIRPSVVNFATQGPCADGFHVPLTDDWVALNNAYTGLGLSGGRYFMEYFKLPFNGVRSDDDAVARYVGSAGYYWSSSSVPNNNTNSYGVQLNYSSYSSTYSYIIQSSKSRCFGYGIRPFKNEPVTPDSSWTTLYNGGTNKGIYYNSSLGLISISSDLTNWITISDKNLGATTAWNFGDTVNADNGGGLFQWGNNYMFPNSGTVTTSRSQVDASAYGPGNYYSSSTFITNYGGRWDRGNRNLWGGEDGNIPV